MQHSFGKPLQRNEVSSTRGVVAERRNGFPYYDSQYAVDGGILTSMLFF